MILHVEIFLHHSDLHQTVCKNIGYSQTLEKTNKISHRQPKQNFQSEYYGLLEIAHDYRTLKTFKGSSFMSHKIACDYE